MSRSVEDVRQFWENAPLWAGESRFQTGSCDYFDEQERIITQDGFAGAIDERIFSAWLHRLLDKHTGFLIYANVVKR
jgi:hypothetical protein